MALSCAPALATTLYDESRRTRVLATYAAFVAAGAALGPIIGGMLVDWFGWSAVFWGRAPLCLAALALTWIIPTPAGRPLAARFDHWGAGLLIVWLSALLLGVAAIATTADPALPLGLGLLFLGALAAFLRHETRIEEPIIRPALFRSLDFAAMNILSIAVSFSAFSIMLLVPYYLVTVRGLDGATGGLVLALAAIGTVGGSWLAGRIGAKVAVGRVALAGIGLSLAGLLGIACLASRAELAPIATALVVQGIGVGLFQVAYVDLVTSVIPLKDRGVAGSLTMVTRTIGVVAGATAHAAIQRIGADRAVTEGAGPKAAFLAGFELAFAAATLVVLLALFLGLLRPSLRGRAPAHVDDA